MAISLESWKDVPLSRASVDPVAVPAMCATLDHVGRTLSKLGKLYTQLQDHAMRVRHPDTRVRLCLGWNMGDGPDRLALQRIQITLPNSQQPAIVDIPITDELRARLVTERRGHVETHPAAGGARPPFQVEVLPVGSQQGLVQLRVKVKLADLDAAVRARSFRGLAEDLEEKARGDRQEVDMMMERTRKYLTGLTAIVRERAFAKAEPLAAPSRPTAKRKRTVSSAESDYVPGTDDGPPKSKRAKSTDKRRW